MFAESANPHRLSFMIHIVIDTREQTPFHFDPYLAQVERGTLRTGDYALKGDDGFAVERKSFDDFLSTISSGWERFKREIGRAKSSGFVLPIVIEGWVDDCLYVDVGDEIMPPMSRLNHPNLTPGFILSRIGELWQLGASVIPVGCAITASAVTYNLLYQRAKELGNEQSGIDDRCPGEAGHMAEA